MTTPILGLILAVVLAALVLVCVRLFKGRPETAEDYLGLAERQFENMRFERAKELCQKALELAPRNAEAYYGLGMCAAMQHRTEEAVEWMQRAAECDPGHADAEYALGVGYEELGRLEEAERHFRRVLDLDPRSADAAAHLAEILTKAGRTAEAEPWQDLAARVRSEGEDDTGAATAEPPPLADKKALAKLRGAHRAREELAIAAAAAFVLFMLIAVGPLRDAVAGGWSLGRLWREFDSVDRVAVPVVFAAVLGFGAAALAAVLSLRSQLGRLRNRGHDVTAIAEYLEWEETTAEARNVTAEREVEGQERREFLEASKQAAPWWSRELSGAHAVWWLSGIFVFVAVAVGEERSNVVGPVFAIAAMGLLLKVVVPFIWLLLPLVAGAPWTWKAGLSLGPTWRGVVSYYRWWGRGFLPMAVALLPAAAYWLAVAW
jgi:thioredoxin-like negative regulator of GroEL